MESNRLEHWILFANRNRTASFIDVESKYAVVTHVAINKTALWNESVLVFICPNRSAVILVLSNQACS